MAEEVPDGKRGVMLLGMFVIGFFVGGLAGGILVGLMHMAANDEGNE